MSLTASVTQLDLFGEVVSAEQQRRLDALVCLRDSMPETLELVVELQRHSGQGSRTVRAGGDWAYCVSPEGLRVEAVSDWWTGAYERGETWGWRRMPAHLIPWDELATLIGQDPRRAEIAAWAESLPYPRWPQLMRPHELWPDPDQWHRSYFCKDHLDRQWPARRHAWQLVLDLLNGAIDQAKGGA